MSEHPSRDWQARISRLETEHGRRLEAHARLLAEVAERVAALERQVIALERRVDRTAAQLIRHQVARASEAPGGGPP